MAGVSAVAVNKKIRNRTLVVNAAGLLDTDNPVNRVYLDTHRARLRESAALEQVAEAARAEAGPTVAGASSPAPPGGSPADGPRPRRASKASRRELARAWAEVGGGVGPGAPAFAPSPTAHDYLSMPVGELVRRHGTVEGVEKYVKILRDLTAADEREQRTQERRGILIPRELVTARVFGYLEQLSGKLLDVPEYVCDQLIAVVQSGENARARVVSLLGESISRAISGAKEQVASELAAYRGGGRGTLAEELAEKIEMMEEKSE